jgi:putative SOS response-associated peptidase YedK
MCNHYEKSTQGTEEAVQRAIAKMNAQVAAEMREWREHTYPKYPAGIIRQANGERECVEMRWGVWPFYQREKPQFITNARSDGLLTKTIWKHSAKKRRCLIPAVAYYEPGLGPPGKRGEVRFAPLGRTWFFIAGLYDQDPDGSGKLGFTMVTAEPNAYAAKYHDRMPVVLSDEDALAWIGDEPLADDVLMDLCRGLPAEQLTHTEIAAAPRGKITSADLKKAIEMPGDEQGDLFA